MSSEIRVIPPPADETASRALLLRIREYLARQEAVNTIQLSGFVASQRLDAAHPVLVALRDDDVAGVATLAPGFNLLISTVDGDDVPLALADAVLTSGLDVPGVMGPSDAAQIFAGHWAAITGGSFVPGMAQRILATASVTAPGEVSGTWRHMQPGDHEMLVTWFAAFGSEADNVAPADARRFGEAMLRRLDDRSGGLLWLDETGIPVSIACYKAPTMHGIRIGPVYTPPDYRRRGYAGAVTAAATQLMLDRGYAFVCLYTDAANPTSNHVYEDLGYTFVADSMQYRFTGGHAS